MLIAVVGAAARTGRLVVEHALGQRHQVTAVARNPEALPLRDPDLQLVRTDRVVEHAFRGVLTRAPAL